MAITKYPPNTIFLGGTRVEINDLIASEAITPGMLVERISVSGVGKWRKQVTAAAAAAKTVATDMHMLNKGVDDNCAVGDLIEVSVLQPGATAWMLVPAAAAAIVVGDKLESAGAGLLRKLAAGVALFTALEDKDNSGGGTSARIRVEAL